MYTIFMGEFIKIYKLIHFLSFVFLQDLRDKIAELERLLAEAQALCEQLKDKNKVGLGLS